MSFQITPQRWSGEPVPDWMLRVVNPDVELRDRDLDLLEDEERLAVLLGGVLDGERNVESVVSILCFRSDEDVQKSGILEGEPS